MKYTIKTEEAIKIMKENRNARFRNDDYILEWDEMYSKIECIGQSFGVFDIMDIDILFSKWEIVPEIVNFEQAIESGKPFRWLGFYSNFKDENLHQFLDLDEFLLEVAGNYFNEEIVAIFKDGEFIIQE